MILTSIKAFEHLYQKADIRKSIIYAHDIIIESFEPLVHIEHQNPLCHIKPTVILPAITCLN